MWHVDLGEFPTMHGPGTSPVLYENLVILIQDQDTGRSLCAAFDKRSGQKVWQRDRPNAMGWSNPVVLRIGDHDELIFNGANEVTSYDPATGEVLWTHSGTSIEAIPMIATGGGLLFSMSGRNGPMFAFRPAPRGGQAQTQLIWRHELGGPHVPSPAYHDGRLYCVNDTGIITCLDATTGTTLWHKRLRGRFSASPLVVADKLLFLNEEGKTYVVKGGARFELLAENDLNETTYATPASVDGRLYFRSTTHLVCVGN
jgi:outer membrane protein assembly factor BamB